MYLYVYIYMYIYICIYIYTHTHTHTEALCPWLDFDLGYMYPGFKYSGPTHTHTVLSNNVFDSFFDSRAYQKHPHFLYIHSVYSLLIYMVRIYMHRPIQRESESHIWIHLQCTNIRIHAHIHIYTVARVHCS